MHENRYAAPDEHGSPRGGAWATLRRLWLRFVGRRSAGFYCYWLALVTCDVVLLSMFGFRGGDGLITPVVLITVLLMGSPDPRIVAIVTGMMFGALGYLFGLPIWLSVVIGIGVGALQWLIKASVRELHPAPAPASNERWSRVRRRYLLFQGAMVVLVMLWVGSIYLHLLAEGDPPTFVNWMLVGGTLWFAFSLWRETRQALTRNA
jgi:hypothetical protein